MSWETGIFPNKNMPSRMVIAIFQYNCTYYYWPTTIIWHFDAMPQVWHNHLLWIRSWARSLEPSNWLVLAWAFVWQSLTRELADPVRAFSSYSGLSSPLPTASLSLQLSDLVMSMDKWLTMVFSVSTTELLWQTSSYTFGQILHLIKDMSTLTVGSFIISVLQTFLSQFRCICGFELGHEYLQSVNHRDTVSKLMLQTNFGIS